MEPQLKVETGTHR